MKTLTRNLFAIAATALSLHVAAATNPTAATADNSQGDFKITLNLTPFIIVNSFEDMILNATSGTDISQSQDICVGGFGFDDYSISFDSANGDVTTPFKLVGTGIGDDIPYSVAFIDQTDGTAGIDVGADGTMGTARFDRAATARDCLDNGVENARITVSVLATQFEDVEDSTFEDTLTVTVSAI